MGIHIGSPTGAAGGLIDGPSSMPSFCDRVGDVAKNVFDFMKHWSGPVVLGLGCAAIIFADASIFIAITGVALLAFSIPLILINHLSQTYDDYQHERTQLINIQHNMNDYQNRLTARINGTDTSAVDDLTLHPFTSKIWEDTRKLARGLGAVGIHEFDMQLSTLGPQVTFKKNYNEIQDLYKAIVERIQIRKASVDHMIGQGIFGPVRC